MNGITDTHSGKKILSLDFFYSPICTHSLTAYLNLMSLIRQVGIIQKSFTIIKEIINLLE